jgi:hypothetical protein
VYILSVYVFAGRHELRRHRDQASKEQTAGFSALQATLLHKSSSDLAGVAVKPMTTGLADNYGNKRKD